MHMTMRALTAALALVSLAAIPVARGVQHAVTVGGPGVLKYDPEFVEAVPGDTILFTFQQKNHTATQSTLENPCALAPNGFDSGFQPVGDDVVDGPFPQAQLAIRDTNPIWVYCRQGNHCQQGMVFAVNPGDQFDAFKAAATGNATATATATTTTSDATATAPPATTPSVVTVTATVTVGDQTLTTTYGSYPGSAQPTSATQTDHLVVVGGPGVLAFTPPNITAQPGDTITFQFKQKNHTVTQSSFSAPCRPLVATSANGQAGFNSGFMPVGDGATTFPTFTITVNSTGPIWAYCAQGNHCGQGMVFAANAVETGPQNFDAFVTLAKTLNGTGSDSGSSSNSAPSIRSGSSAGFLLGAAALVLGMAL